MSSITVSHVAGDRFAIALGEHTLMVDQPIQDGGEGAAPTPTELFVASLASCVAHYARRYLARHHLSTDGLTVSADYQLGSGPARVSAVQVVVTVSPDVPAARREALLAVASHCTVHNSLTSPPSVQVTLQPAPVLQG